MNNPIATYRFQFHKDFSLKEFEAIIPYLKKLGVSTVYASPIFESTPGSTHGYDGLNPHRINPEIGTEADFQRIARNIHEEGFQWLQDIVPNHMAYSSANLWIWDVFQKGKRSVYEDFFDIDWENPVSPGQIMAPFLGDTLENVIRENQLQLAYRRGQLVWVVYDETEFPVNPDSYATILAEVPEAKSLLESLKKLEEVSDNGLYGVQLSELLLQPMQTDEDLLAAVEAQLKKINGSADQLAELASQQYFRLCHYAETDYQINFRRFFTVNGLICLNIQKPEVFEHFHKYIQSLVDTGVFQGLRIDHIDGLYNPSRYLEQLRDIAGPETYITVEKILEPGEKLNESWPIQGNTGYDFLSYVNNLFTNKAAEKPFTQYYQKLTGDKDSVQEQIHRKKAMILLDHMGGELDNLVRLYTSLSLPEMETEALKDGIALFLIHCPVYRYYGNAWPLGEEEQQAIKEIFKAIRQQYPEKKGTINALEKTLQLEEALPFYQRCMQFSGPLMAKGVEDTLLYTYTRFIGHNEVGDSVEEFGITSEHYHALMADRQEHWPLSLNGTSTHDTKRGEDVRGRLNALTDLPEQWIETVSNWFSMHPSTKLQPNDQYLIYQTVVGAHPMPGQDDDDFENRLHEYLPKALREGKVNSTWTQPDESYEQAAKDFASSLLDKSGDFYKIFESFHRTVCDWGIVNSLAQTLLKFTSPGVPDVYQGTELWDLSLVDPDNRRPVDYSLREKYLDEMDSLDWRALWQHRYSGQIKLWLTHQLFQERKENADTFTQGLYLPLAVEGTYKDHVLAFARRYKQNWYVVAVPLHAAQIGSIHEVLEIDWKDTRVVLPEDAPQNWQNLLGSASVSSGCLVQDLFSELPFALLKGQPDIRDRSAGLLLAVTSLPSAFGVGDLGPEAYKFADFLSKSKQSYWQLLPLNPTGEDQGFSPYSSISSRAGNPILISPESLQTDGLLGDLADYRIMETPEADFKQALALKYQLLEQAYAQYQKRPLLKREFDTFCLTEAEWLDDFVLYVVIKQQQENKPWFEWPDALKHRDALTLQDFKEAHAEQLVYQRWIQFIFFRQWHQLRRYSNVRNVKLFGDLPFYPSYDSVDVWANPELFYLDEQGNMTCVAGVPPDYFNEDGQRWGMPIYRWDVLKARKYDWWLNRISKNMELYDLLRLDHFRAFASYWEVPAQEKSAKNGEWKPGPGLDFFDVLREKLGSLPLVAEDLGDIGSDVYELRDACVLPGMRVLHFAFSDEMPKSVNILHNHMPLSIAYTGTHDNNTTKGWYRNDLSAEDHRRLEEYLGGPLKEETIHFVLIRMVYSSVAQTAILPVQDVLGLDESARMNTPAGNEACWKWRLIPGQLTQAHEEQLRKWAETFHRG